MKYSAKPIALALLASCALYAAASFAASDYVILEVDGNEIKKSQVDTLWKGLFPQGAAPDFEKVEEPIRQNVLRGVVSEYLLLEEATKAKIDQSPEVQKQLEDLKRKLIVRAFIEGKSKGLVADSEVRSAYDKLAAETRKQEEVRARHILVDSESKAKDLKKKLDNGASFEKLAGENSADPGSKKQGGDLGYFTKDKMVAEFSKAAFAMKKGDVSEPVKSDFGWHLIKVEDRRAATPPKFEEVKEKLKAQLVEDRLGEYVNKLVDAQDIKYFGPDGKERELTKTPDSIKTKTN